MSILNLNSLEYVNGEKYLKKFEDKEEFLNFINDRDTYYVKNDTYKVVLVMGFNLNKIEDERWSYRYCTYEELESYKTEKIYDLNIRDICEKADLINNGICNRYDNLIRINNFNNIENLYNIPENTWYNDMYLYPYLYINYIHNFLGLFDLNSSNYKYNSVNTFNSNWFYSIDKQQIQRFKDENTKSLNKIVQFEKEISNIIITINNKKYKFFDVFFHKVDAKVEDTTASNYGTSFRQLVYISDVEFKKIYGSNTHEFNYPKNQALGMFFNVDDISSVRKNNTLCFVLKSRTEYTDKNDNSYCTFRYKINTTSYTIDEVFESIFNSDVDFGSEEKFNNNKTLKVLADEMNKIIDVMEKTESKKFKKIASDKKIIKSNIEKEDNKNELLKPIIEKYNWLVRDSPYDSLFNCRDVDFEGKWININNKDSKKYINEIFECKEEYGYASDTYNNIHYEINKNALNALINSGLIGIKLQCEDDTKRKILSIRMGKRSVNLIPSMDVIKYLEDVLDPYIYSVFSILML